MLASFLRVITAAPFFLPRGRILWRWLLRFQLLQLAIDIPHKITVFRRDGPTLDDSVQRLSESVFAIVFFHPVPVAGRRQRMERGHGNHFQQRRVLQRQESLAQEYHGCLGHRLRLADFARRSHGRLIPRAGAGRFRQRRPGRARPAAPHAAVHEHPRKDVTEQHRPEEQLARTHVHRPHSAPEQVVDVAELISQVRKFRPQSFNLLRVTAAAGTSSRRGTGSELGNAAVPPHKTAAQVGQQRALVGRRLAHGVPDGARRDAAHVQDDVQGGLTNVRVRLGAGGRRHLDGCPEEGE
mmetsp:Transcript_30362/g.90518  ORF Transcript_30362/g.90518 Transcript_30362/m.90518 type:complete len:296 (+) Transcript_30362:1659-2546(+)